MSTGSMTQVTPIFRLDNDVLHEIFLINTYRLIRVNFDSYRDTASSQVDRNLSPLAITRRTSQVCRTWRDILLQSPSIWGRCIDLDVLNTSQDQWRDLVLQRTGRAMLSVTASSAPWVPKRGPESYDILDKEWERIEEIKLGINLWELVESRILERFINRRAENLRLCVLYVSFAFNPYDVTLPSTMHLFSNYAPSLVHLSIPCNIHNLQINTSSPSMFSRHLRHLELGQALEICPSDLLAVCLQVPLIETLKILISRLITNDVPEENLPRPILPRLNMIHIISSTLYIYPMFMDRIEPSAGCALIMVHPGIDEQESELSRPLESMQRVFYRYADSFFAHHRGQSNFVDVALDISHSNFDFNCYQRRFDMRIYQLRGSDVLSIIFARLLDTISAFNFPSTVSRLEFNIDPMCRALTVPAPGGCSSTISSKVYHALKSMHWVTVLVTAFGQTVSPNSETLSDHEEIFPSSEIIFPSLNTLEIKHVSTGGRLQIALEPYMHYFARRQATAPLEVLHLDFGKMPPWANLRFLDEIVGLKVVWRGDGRVGQYVCGSGDPDQLVWRPPIDSWLSERKQVTDYIDL